MQKIFFHSSPFTIAKTRIKGELLNGCIYPRASSIADLKSSFAQTGNKGNMVHSEAPLKLFKHNLSRSCVGNLVHAHESLKDEFSNFIKQNFDVVILSMANFIRKKQDHSKIVEALKQVEIPIILFSGGLQDKLSSLDNLTISTIELLHLLDKKAQLFSVRGSETANFLKAAGLNNHVVCGCPSMYVYPRNILSIKPLVHNSNLKIATAGHFSLDNLATKTSKSSRANDLKQLLGSMEADYIFQDEIFSYNEILDEDAFDDARQRFYPGVISEYLKNQCNVSPQVNEWYYFNEVSSWRIYMASRDLYFGDRFHGGVVALQCSTPAIIIKGDLRVRELTDFFDIPSTTFLEATESGVEATINDNLNSQNIDNFHNTYRSRLDSFRSVCSQVGLNLA